MKMKKMSFTLLGTTSIVGSMLTTIVSCGSSFNGRYDTDNDNQIIVRTTWSQSGGNFSKYHILNTLVDVYNKEMKSHNGFMPVKLEHVEGGYGTIASQTITKIKAHDKKTLPNLFTDYPTAAAEILGYEMQLNFEEQSTFNSSNIDANWLANANIIGGNKKKHIINTPYSISSDTLSLNKSLMHKFLHDIESSNSGATINDKSTDGIIKQILDFNPTASDTSEINRLWGATMSNSSVFNNYVISNSTFSSFKSVFEFGSKIMSAYGKNSRDSEGLHFLGYDSPTNLLFSIAKSLSKSSATTHHPLVSLNDNGFVSYDVFSKELSKKTFKDAAKIILDAINSGSLWLGTGGAYASDYFKRHKMGLAIGSSAGITYLFSSEATTSKIVLNNKDVFGVQAHKNHDVVTMVLKDGHLNKIYTNAKASIGSYDFKFKTAAEEAKVSDSKFIVAPDKTNDGNFLSSHSGVPFVVIDSHNNDHTFYAFDSTSTPVVSNALVNEDEINTYPAIFSATSNSNSKILFTNGPNLVGVHANKLEDMATALFATWLYNSTNTYTDLENLSPVNYLISKAEYIVPIKNFLQTNSLIHNAINTGLQGHSAKYWKGNEQVFKGLNEAKSNANISLYVEGVPIDEYSQSIREYIDKIFQSALDGSHQGTNLTVDSIYSKFTSSAKSGGIIS